MRLISQYHSTIDAQDHAEILESVGIPTYISSKHSHSLSRYRTGAMTVGLWVMLNHQYDDAISYLNNRKHTVTTGISQEEINYLKAQAKIRTFNEINKHLAFAGLLAVILIFVFIV